MIDPWKIFTGVLIGSGALIILLTIILLLILTAILIILLEYTLNILIYYRPLPPQKYDNR